MYSFESISALSWQGHHFVVLAELPSSSKGTNMKQLIALFAILAASSLAQAQNMGAPTNHPEARNDRTPSSYAANDNHHQVGKKAHRHGKKKHHHRKHHRAM